MYERLQVLLKRPLSDIVRRRRNWKKRDRETVQSLIERREQHLLIVKHNAKTSGSTNYMTVVAHTHLGLYNFSFRLRLYRDVDGGRDGVSEDPLSWGLHSSFSFNPRICNMHFRILEMIATFGFLTAVECKSALNSFSAGAS